MSVSSPYSLLTSVPQSLVSSITDMMTMLLLPLILVTTSGALSLDMEEMAATDACEGLALEELPTAYETNMMMNIKFGDINGQSRSIYEAVDGDKMKSFIHVATGDNVVLC